MISKKFLLQPLAVAALMCASGASNAALTVYTSAAAFAAATASAGVDTFSNFSIADTTTSPTTRSAGAYGYTASANTDSFIGIGTSGNPSLSTNTATDTITFSAFTGNPNAIGGNFFGTNIDGDFVAGSFTFTVADSLGATSTQTIVASGTSSFVGFVSTGFVMSLSLVAVQSPDLSVPFIFPTVDNLTLATVAAVPEPETYALMLAGLGIMGFMAKRRRG